MEDDIPETRDGQIVALADKLDTLRECFRVGMVPTGSKDPFALRRAAQGVVKILVEGKLDYPIRDLVNANPWNELYDFMLDRMGHYFREVKGFKYDEVNAVLKAEGPPSSVYQVQLRLEALAGVRPTENFEPLAAGFKRIRNILRQSGVPDQAFDVSLVESGPEREMYDAYERVHGQISGTPIGYKAELETIATLRPYVDRFFDAVMVNAPDPTVRGNRLAFLLLLSKTFSTIADFSEIVTAGEK
jgi:glycyl-tRNA synthetase beta chain